MKNSPAHYHVGVALVAALEPLIDVCLATGLTSPEFESLLRVAFVLRAFARVPGHARTGRPPTANKVALATGVHWKNVAAIKAAGPVAAKQLMQTRERASSKAARVMQGWATDPKFLTSGGVPMDLPIKTNRQKRSWTDLVKSHAPSTHPGALLREMARRQQVVVSDADIVRYRRSKTRLSGLTPAAIAEASRYVKQLGDTLFAKLADPNSPLLYEQTDKISVAASQLPLIRPVLERRTAAFLLSLESEFNGRGLGVKEAAVDLGVGVFTYRKLED